MRLAAFVLMVLSWPLVIGPAHASPPPHGINERMLVERNMPVLEIGGIRVYHSASSRDAAEAYGKAIAAMLAWTRSQIEWGGRMVVAVLDEDDWGHLVTLPYPVPHAQYSGSMVVMPDRIDGFPGFDLWDFEPVALNVALTFHEAGHLIAHQLDIHPGNHWINELVANLFMAAYVRAERQDLAAILGGVPARFANPGPYDQLVDLDNFYAGGGLENYAWFQFRLAELADAMVREKPLALLVERLGKEFPARPQIWRETMARTLARMESIAPGATATVSDMTGDGVLPALSPVACDTLAPASDGDEAVRASLFVENRSGRPYRYRIPAAVADAAASMLRTEFMLGKLAEDEFAVAVAEAVEAALADENSMTVLAPGHILRSDYRAGAVVELEDGLCLAFPDGPSRFVVGEGG